MKQTGRHSALHLDRSPFAQISRLSLDLENICLCTRAISDFSQGVECGETGCTVQGPQKLPEDEQGNTVVDAVRVSATVWRR